MIDPKILKILQSNSLNPGYSVVIDKFYQPESCNKDELQMKVLQVNPNLFTIINKKDAIISQLKELLTENNIAIPDTNDLSINNIVAKTLAIDSILNYDQTEKLFTSGLSGRIVEESNQPLPGQTVQGKIKNKRITFTTKDYPVLLDYHKIIVKNDQIVINLPNNIETIDVKISHANLVATYNNTNRAIITFPDFHFNTIEDRKITINISDIKEQLINSIQNEIDILKSDAQTDITNLQASIVTGTEENPLTSEQEENNASVLEEITQLENQIQEYNEKEQAMIYKIEALSFTSTQPYDIDIKYTYASDISANAIECINFELKSEITIEFLNKYLGVPGIIITINAENKIYSSYDTIFTTDNNGYYDSVTIKFNNLKRIRQPIDVNAIIIGDKIA